jgi:hypothetical protein
MPTNDLSEISYMCQSCGTITARSIKLEPAGPSRMQDDAHLCSRVRHTPQAAAVWAGAVRRLDCWRGDFNARCLGADPESARFGE